MFDLLLTGASVLTPDGVQRIDVAIADGRIAALGSDLGDANRTIACTDMWIGPGLVDLHTHLREPGQEWKEDIASGSAAAAAGGYTALVAMPNTDPPIDAGHLARYVADRAAEVGLVDVMSAGCISMGREGSTMAHIDDLWNAGVRLFTDDGDSVESAALLRSAMDYIGALGGVVSQHAVDRSLSQAGFMHEGSVSSRLGMYGIPAEADDIAIARDLAIAELTGARYHVQHLSTARGVELVAAAKDAGLRVTAEVTPHHLAFDHHAVASTDSNYKMMPPLRGEDDRAALLDGVRSGVIDAVATDHAPHAALEKEVPFEHAPNGVLGLEWAASIAVGTAGLDQTAFFERCSIAPARIAGFANHGQVVGVGSEANLAVIDPTATWDATETLSKSRNAPYLGTQLTGKVVATVLRGTVTHDAHPIGEPT